MIEATAKPNCYLCDEEGDLVYADLADRLYSTPGQWNLLRCRHCGLVWLSPRPRPEELPRLYAEYYTHTVARDAWRTSLGRAWRKIEPVVLEARLGYRGPEWTDFKTICGQVLGRLPLLFDVAAGSVMWLRRAELGRLLDVGCGNGTFLSRMRDLGWKVVGVEPDPVSAQVGREKFGLNVHTGTLEQASLPSGAFDIITLNHVIEHVSDPIGLLRECKRVLCPQGRVVIVTPNVNGLGRRLFQSQWYHLDPPRHLFLFSPEALNRCAEAAGLRIDNARTTARGARAVWHNSRRIRKHGKLPTKRPATVSIPIRIEGYVFWIVEGLLLRFSRLGEELLLVAHKP